MKNAIKKIMAFVLVIAMIAGVLPSVFAASEYVEPFKDVKTTDWFAPYVTYVYEHDPQLMNGVTKDTFAPNGTCTRAMAAVVLYRLADPVIPSVKPSTFTDLKQDWYKNGIAWAQQNGVVNGVTETTFVPDGLVLREQLVTMLWRYAGEPKVAEDYLKSFPDREKVSYYAREAFNWAISLEIIGGANGMLNPQGNATRAEFAKILSVFAQKTAPCQHKWDEGKVTKEATCTATGVMTYTCTLCGETKTETIPMIAHNYVDGVCSVCGAQEPDPGPGPGPGPEPTPGNEYVLASEIKDGDEVIIYNPGHGKAIKNENDNNWYLIAQEITPADSKITTDDTTIVWTANKNDDGTFTFTNGENAITAWLSENDKGTFVELTNDANYTGGDTKWNVTTCNAATNTFFISSSSIATSYGPGHIECYAKSGVDKIAGFGKANPTETDFGFQFYVKGGTAPDPGPGPEPTPGNEYVLTSELKEGDEVVIVCAAKNVAL
ncbi:MAG: S-layer homology domain-containing protein, partial [Faecousia sp.]